MRGDCEECERKGVILKQITKNGKDKQVCINSFITSPKELNGEVVCPSCFDICTKDLGWKEKEK